MGRGKGSTPSKQEDIVIEHLMNIGKYGCALKASDHVIERAQIIFKELIETNGSLRNRNHCAIYAACLYVAGRQHDEMKTLREVTEKNNVEKRDIFKALQFINEVVPDVACPTLFLTSPKSQQQQHLAEVNENDRNDKCNQNPNPISDDVIVAQRLKAHVNRLCDVLKFDSEQAKCAEDMARMVANSNLGLTSLPTTQAAAIIWISSLLTGSKKVDVKAIVQQTTGKLAIRKTYKLLVPHLPALLPRHILGDTQNWKEKLKLP